MLAAPSASTFSAGRVVSFRIRQDHGRGAVAGLADEDALRRLRRGGPGLRDGGLALLFVLNRVRGVQLIDEMAQRGVRPVPDLEAGAPQAVVVAA